MSDLTDRQLLEEIHERVCTNNLAPEIFDSILQESTSWRMALPYFDSYTYVELELIRNGSIITINLLQNGQYVFCLGKWYRD